MSEQEIILPCQGPSANIFKYIQIFRAVVWKGNRYNSRLSGCEEEYSQCKTHTIVTDKSCSDFEKWLHFSVAFRGLQHKLFFRVPFEQLLNPSIYSFSFTDWISFMHKAPTHAIGLLMTGPYADTLTAMSNYFKYTGESQSWADLWEVERGGKREWRGGGETRGRRHNPLFFHLNNRFDLTYKNWSFHFITKIHQFVLFIGRLFLPCRWQLRNLTAALIPPSPSETSLSVV